MKALTVIFSLFSCVAMAQTEVGIYFGYTDAHQKYADWVEVPEDGDPSIDAWNAGLMFIKPLGNKLELESRLGWARRGAACFPGFVGIGPEPEPFEGDTKWLVDYAEVPLKVNYKLRFLKDKLQLSLGAGYGISYAFKAKQQVLDFTDDSMEESELLVGEFGRVNRIDHGIYSSARVSYSILNMNLFSSITYYAGMRNVEPWNYSRNRAVSVNVGILKSL